MQEALPSLLVDEQRSGLSQSMLLASPPNGLEQQAWPSLPQAMQVPPLLPAGVAQVSPFPAHTG
jgi:hypothetical protein